MFLFPLLLLLYLQLLLFIAIVVAAVASAEAAIVVATIDAATLAAPIFSSCQIKINCFSFPRSS